MYTIGDLVKQFKLSRSTLLYYDKIGLLISSGRSDANYRLYTEEDCSRMMKISVYKETGLSLNSISKILSYSDNQASKLLEQRLESLNAEMSHIRHQQQHIVQFLEKDSLLRSCKLMNKSQWIAILNASGMDENSMRQWHIEFERDLPEVHSDFLESLGMDDEEICSIKAWSKAGAA